MQVTKLRLAIASMVAALAVAGGAAAATGAGTAGATVAAAPVGPVVTWDGGITDDTPWD